MVGLFKEKSLQHFSCFSIFSNGDLVRTTFFKCPYDAKIYGWVLHMSYYPMIVSDPKCITYPSRTKQSHSWYNHIFLFFQYLQRVILSVAPFANVCTTQKKIWIWSSHVVLSPHRLRSRLYYISIENEAIRFWRKSIFSTFANGDFSIAPFANVCTTQKKYGSDLHISYCPMIVSDPTYITDPSRTKLSNL